VEKPATLDMLREKSLRFLEFGTCLYLSIPPYIPKTPKKPLFPAETGTSAGMRAKKGTKDM
jgi:hypothetical protein